MPNKYYGKYSAPFLAYRWDNLAAVCEKQKILGLEYKEKKLEKL